MSMLTTFLAAVSVAEIVVLVVECVLAVTGAAVILILQNAIKKSRRAGDSGAVVDGVQPKNDDSDVISRNDPDPAVSTPQNDEAKLDATATVVPEVTENVSRSDSVNENKDRTISKEDETAKADELTSAPETNSDSDDSDGKNKENDKEEVPQSARHETHRKSAAEIFAEYEKRSGDTVVNDAQPEVELSDLSGKVSELQTYLNQIKSGSDKRDNSALVRSENSGDKNDFAKQNEGSGDKKTHSDERLSYIDPASPSAKNDAAFTNYSETDKDYLLKHIAKSREQYSSMPRPEHEKVDWDKVKQYNSAILSVGEFGEDTDKK